MRPGHGTHLTTWQSPSPWSHMSSGGALLSEQDRITVLGLGTSPAISATMSGPALHLSKTPCGRINLLDPGPPVFLVPGNDPPSEMSGGLKTQAKRGIPCFWKR